MVCTAHPTFTIEKKQKMEIPDDNFINIKPEEYNSPIYRVTTIDRLLDMLKSKNLILRRPKLWEDPFENSLS